MEFTARQLAAFLYGELIGDPDVKVNNVSKIEAGKPGTLTFLANPKYTSYIYSTKASIVLVNRDFVPEQPIEATLIKVPNAYEALAKLMDMYVQSIPRKKGIEISTYISSSATLGENCYVGAFSYVGENVKIGNNVQIYPQCYIGDNTVIKDDSILYAGVKIYAGTQIGCSCILHSGVVLGSDGFGFAPQEDGSFKKLQQIGNVILEDNVEIGSNSTIDCATMGATIIRKGVKLDNLVQIAHNVEIGENTVIAALSGVAGSSSIGESCMIAGQVGIAGHLKVGNNVTLAAKTGVTNNIPDNATEMGTYSFDAGKYRRSHIAFRNLPDLVKEVHRLNKELTELKKKI
jgi:UDP-3-O-[3-hydroxymyristoyl] glucosamine N-acyltransferase